MPADPKPEDWSILGVVAGACTHAEARAAYLARATALHPDRHPDLVGDARERLDRAMAALNAAWDRIDVWWGWDTADGPWAEGRPGPRRNAGAAPDEGRADPPVADPDLPPLPTAPPGFRLVRAHGFGHLSDLLELVGTSRDLLRLVDLDGVACGRLRCADRPLDEDHLEAALTALPLLRALDLDGTGVTDRTATFLPHRVPGLADLHLSDTAVTDDALLAIARLRALHSLSLAGTGVTDAGLAHLARHPKLAVLNLRATRVEGPGLLELAECPDLRLLALPRVPRAHRQALADRRPDVAFT